jgi:acyl-coenzyme A thioesterase PaaI-like protein
MSTSKSEAPLEPQHVMGSLGLMIEAVGDELHGTAEIVPTMWAPGTSALRTSIIVAWTDVILGLLAVRVVAPRVPVTLDIDVHLFHPADGTEPMQMIGRVTKVGTSAQVFSIDLFDPAGRPVGFGHATFMASPNPALSIPTGDWALAGFNGRRGVLTAPLAELLNCTRTDIGVARLPNGPHARNAVDTLNGGLLAVAVEEAVLAASLTPSSLTSMQLRYLRPVRADAIATARVHDGLGQVEIHDSDSGALAVLATTRSVSL